MKKLLLIAAAVLAAYWIGRQPAEAPREPAVTAGQPAPVAISDALGDAFENRRSGIQVSGEGRVARILGDDSLGDRHQRFILELATGQTLLVAHNIDLAPRIDALRVGDFVAFNGEYEWNDRGGVIHWTHHDPEGRHEAGWLKHGGRTYR